MFTCHLNDYKRNKFQPDQNSQLGSQIMEIVYRMEIDTNSIVIIDLHQIIRPPHFSIQVCT